MVAPADTAHVHGDGEGASGPLTSTSEGVATHGSVRSDKGPLASQHNEEQEAPNSCAIGGNAAEACGVPRAAAQ